jgi:transcriptional regulator with XRE-family HTH domain
MRVPTYRFAGELVERERERQGLTREQYAVRMGCSVALVLAVERGYEGHRNPSAAKAARFAGALGRRVDDFMVVDNEQVPA